jgi:hypothetical protein
MDGLSSATGEGTGKMPISRVFRNTDLAVETAAAANVWADDVGRRLEELLSPYLQEGEGMPDMRLFQSLIGRLLADRERQLRASYHQHRQHDVSATALRGRRDQAARALREELRNARHFLEQARGKGEGARRGIGEGLSYMAPSLMVQVARHVADVLGMCEREGAGSPTLPPPGALAKEIEARAQALEQALANLVPEHVQESVSRHEKRQNVESTENAVRRTAAFLIELYKLCGREDLVKRVRPVFRRRRKGSGKPQNLAEREEASLLPEDEEIVRLPTGPESGRGD